jgi:hypothetical protein
MRLTNFEILLLRGAMIGGAIYLFKTMEGGKGRGMYYLPDTPTAIRTDQPVTSVNTVDVEEPKKIKVRKRKKKKAGNLFQKIFKRKYLPDEVI